MLFAILFTLGGVIRIALLSNAGFEFDLEFFRRWAMAIRQDGFGPLGRTIPCDYMPLYLEVLPLVAWVAELLRVEFTSGSTRALVLLKAPAIAADVLCTGVLYFGLRRQLGGRRAGAAALLCWLNPAILFTSAAWGQVDSIVCLFTLLSLLLLARERFLWAGFVLGLAIMTKLQPVLLIPVFILFAWIRAQSNPGSIGAAALEGTSIADSSKRRTSLGQATRAVRSIGSGAIGFISACVLATLPFVLAGNGSYIRKVLTSSVDSQPRLALGATNFWWLFHGNEAKRIWDGYRWGDSLSFKETGLMALAGLALAAIIVALRSMPRFRRAHPSESSTRIRQDGDEAGLYWFAFFVGIAFYMVPTQMHERYIIYSFPALVLVWASATGSAAHATQSPVRRGIPTSFLLYAILSVTAFLTISANLAANYPENVPWLALHSSNGLETRISAAINVVLFLCLLAWAWRKLASGWLLLTLPVAVLAIAFAARTVEFRVRGIPLSEIQPIALRQQFGTTHMNAAASGGPLQIAGRTFSKGLGTVAPSRIVYGLDGKYERLTLRAALDDRNPEGSAARIAIVGDRSPRFESVVQSGQSEPALVDVDLHGVDELILAAEPGEANSDPERIQGKTAVDWLDPRLFR